MLVPNHAEQCGQPNVRVSVYTHFFFKLAQSLSCFHPIFFRLGGKVPTSTRWIEGWCRWWKNLNEIASPLPRPYPRLVGFSIKECQPLMVCTTRSCRWPPILPFARTKRSLSTLQTPIRHSGKKTVTHPGPGAWPGPKDQVTNKSPKRPPPP